MSTTTKPVIAIVPGGWHSPTHFEPLISALSSLSYKTCCLRLPSVDPPNPKDISSTTDAIFIQERLLLPLLDAGDDVVLVMHSYGGVPGGAACKGLSKAERAAAGRRGGIIGLVFVAAFLMSSGASMVGAVGAKLSSWVVVHEDTGYLTVSDPITIFYADVEPGLAVEMIAALRPHSSHAMTSPCPPVGYKDSVYDGRRAYMRCSNDAAIPCRVQEAIIKASGVEFEVTDIESSHSPFLSKPMEVAEYVASKAAEWAK